ncbi:hypothetical protein ET445_08355 [Agromyces protaetiae]|uniref:MFS transporter n=1 Tax=Agromyces protaetiae TaxID=2509455 RepID=A0A4P6FBY3_9MICO|nr:hypothetical protein [Agromyces protaetiae]QAY73354.1 hypothetical protein ET445_08355 [Agromyces protaetiae]
MRRFSAAAIALGLALGGALLPAAVSAADSDDGTSVIDVPAPDGAPSPDDAPHDPAPGERRFDPGPAVSYDFAPAEVDVAVDPGKGSHIAGASISRVGGAPAQQCGGDASWNDPVVSCAFTGLDTGEWLVRGGQDFGWWKLHWRWESHSDAPWGGWWAWSWRWHSEGLSPFTAEAVVTIPATPMIGSAVVAADGSLAVSGSGGSAGDAVHVLDASWSLVCDATVDGAGAWVCAAGGPFTAGASLVAVEEDAHSGCWSGFCRVPGGLSAVSGPVQTTAAPVAPRIVVDPAWAFSIAGIDLSSIHPGDAFSISGSHLPPGLDVSVVLHSDPVTLATTAVGGDGAFAARATVPVGTEPGVHRVVVTLSGQGIEPTSKEVQVTVAAVPVAAAAQALVAASTGTGLTPSFVPPLAAAPAAAPPTEREEPVEHVAEAEHEAEPPEPHGLEGELEPNILTDALEPITVVFTNPQAVASSFAIGLVLIILAMVPAHLLNATIAEQYQRFGGRFANVRRPRWYDRLVAWLGSRTSVGAIVLVAVTAMLLGFADPHFGFNEHSLRLIIALAIALFYVAFVTNWITALILKTRWSVAATISVRPLGIILTVLGVIASRFLDFSPGFLIGLVLGLSISTTAIHEFAWRAVAIRSSLIIGAGLAAWIGYSIMTVHGEPHDFWGALWVETLVAIAAEGIVLLLVDLLPFKLLEGERLWEKSRWLWAAFYLVTTVLFIVTVASWEGNWRELGGAVWLWVATVSGFALVSVLIYLYFRFWAPPLPEEQPGEEVPLERVE